MIGAANISANHAWTGSRYVNVMKPTPEDMDPFEIATGLSREARYGAACTSEFWSVAQHSLLALHLAQEDGVTDRRDLRTLLLHDAPEYMLRDLIRPVKRNCPSYHVLEMTWWLSISARFDLPETMPSMVKRYDNLTLAVEKAALVSPDAGVWFGIPASEDREIPASILGLSMNQARDTFLDSLSQLL